MSQYPNKVCLFAGDYAPEGWLPCNGKNGAPNLPPLTYELQGYNGKYQQKIQYIYRDANFPDEQYDLLIGLIIPFAGSFAPEYTLFCQGQKLKITDNQALFSVIGAKFGGDYTREFGLPNIPPILNTGSNKTPINYSIILQGAYPMRS